MDTNSARTEFDKLNAHHLSTAWHLARRLIQQCFGWIRQSSGLQQAEAKLIEQSGQFWSNDDQQDFRPNSHWRGEGIFVDEDRWLALGREHLEWFDQMARSLGNQSPELTRIVEWGSGGGANAIHFAPRAQQYFAVDISRPSLDECGKQMENAGLRNFVPVLIDPVNPEGALSTIAHPCDLFLCFYVFELLPTPEYGLRVLQFAYELLKPGGLAFIQTRYMTASWSTKPKRWRYAKNMAVMTSYRIEEFWEAAERIGFTPRLIKLLPKQPLNCGERYAYYLLQK